MSVYVDDMAAPHGRMIMCHMIADSHDELVRMADKLQISRKWIQQKGTYREHFDICRNRRIEAVYLGAIQITQRELVARVKARQGVYLTL